MGKVREAALVTNERALSVLPSGLEHVGDDVVGEVYETIVRMRRRAEFEFVLATGRLILERFYGGDVEHFRRSGPKDQSLKRLAARFKEGGVTGMSAVWLDRAVQLWLIEREQNVSARKRLRPRHVMAVIGLPAADQAALLAQAEEQELSTRELEERVREVRQRIRRETGETRGRRPDPAFVRSLKHMGTWLLEDEAFADLDHLADLDQEKVERLHRIAEAGKRRFAEIETLLDARLRDFGPRGRK